MTRLKELRESSGKSMAQVSRDMNIPYTTYVGYEKGAREPNSETLIALASYYNVSVDYIIGRSDISSATDGEEEYLLAARSKDGKQAVRRLTKKQYEIASALIDSLELNEDENL